jgi:hypothetical protein
MIDVGELTRGDVVSAERKEEHFTKNRHDTLLPILVKKTTKTETQNNPTQTVHAGRSMITIPSSSSVSVPAPFRLKSEPETECDSESPPLPPSFASSVPIDGRVPLIDDIDVLEGGEVSMMAGVGVLSSDSLGGSFEGTLTEISRNVRSI